MANILDRLIFVKDPHALPLDIPHEVSVDVLSRQYQLVVLFSHGDLYDFPDNWILPQNVKLVQYDLDTSSIQATVIRLRDILATVGIHFESRFLGMEALPIPLSGALIRLNTKTEFTCLNSPSDYLKHVKAIDQPNEEQTTTDWDL
jgi:hypothetical protein